MSADRVKRQCRRIFILSAEASVRNKSQLDERLETVADAQDQAVSVFQKIRNRLFHLFVPEACREELRRSVRFITCRETAREHDHLRLLNCLFKGIHRLADAFRRNIAEYPYNRSRARFLKGRCRIIFAVCSGEDRDKYGRLSDLVRAYMHFLRAIKRRRNRLFGICGNRRENAFQCLLPCVQRTGNGNRSAAVGKLPVIRNRADNIIVNVFERCKAFHVICRDFYKKISCRVLEKSSCRNRLFKCHAQLIAKRHLRSRRCNAVRIQCVSGNRNFRTDEPRNLPVQIDYLVIHRDIILVLRNIEADKNVSRVLELRCQHLVLLPEIDREGNQCLRYIDHSSVLFIKGSRARILTADRRDAVSDLRVVGAEERAER